MMPLRSMSIRFILGVTVWATLNCGTSPVAVAAVEVVQASLGKDTAWVGEPMPLIVTLFSPGPFDGTAAFDLPDLSRAAILKIGNPVVGSQEVDGDTYFTQRHEFKIFTQRAGEIVVPAFQVRFSGKKSFTSDPEPMTGLTAELHFESRRPPGTESLGLVVSATNMTIEQVWTPEPTRKIRAGDVIERSITRTAEGTTAMMLAPISGSAPDGIKVYQGDPEVEDRVNRGDTVARRKDVLKYQFQLAGTFTLPDLEFDWWNPSSEQVESQTISGITVAVSAAEIAQVPIAESTSNTPTRNLLIGLATLAVLGLGIFLLRKPAARLVHRWRSYIDRPEAIAVRNLRSACAANDASAAHAALLKWETIQRHFQHGGEIDGGSNVERATDDLNHETWQAAREELNRHLFAADQPDKEWDGAPLWKAFRMAYPRCAQFHLLHLGTRHATGAGQSDRSQLPALNPTR